MFRATESGSFLFGNEMFHYVELRHRTRFLDTMWDIGEAIRDCRYIEVEYGRMKGSKVVTRKVKPVALMFSEYYFYLTAFIDDEEVRKDFDVLNDSFPTIYRIDRIRKLKVLEERFIIPYRARFEEGGVQEADSVHVWREAAEGEVQVLRGEHRSRAGQAAYGADSFGGGWGLCGFGGGLWEGDWFPRSQYTQADGPATSAIP